MPKPVEIDELLKSGLIKTGDNPELKVKWVPFGVPMLDDMLGGGIPLGRVVQAYGPESTGKTLLAQMAAAAIQKYGKQVLYMDMERSYDKEWWDQSGVDTEKLMVSSPQTAEQAIDVMRSVISGMLDVAIVILDSVPAMTPAPEMDPEKSADDKRMGLQAALTGQMYRVIIPLLGNRCNLWVVNQMRDGMGTPNELENLPGGRASRHYPHMILRTRRDSWITDAKGARIGYNMEISARKNKVSSPRPGIILPILFHGQLDLLTSYITSGLEGGFITRKGAYYYFGQSQGYMGMDKFREYFLNDAQAMQDLKDSIGAL